MPSNPTKPTTIQFSRDNGATWQNLGCIAAGGTTATVGGVSPGQPLLFRAFTGGLTAGASPNASMMAIPGPHSNAAAAATQSSGPGGAAGTTTSATQPVTSSVPIIHYVAINTGGQATTTVCETAIDDSNTFSYYYKKTSASGTSTDDRTFCVVTCSNGMAGDPTPVVMESDITDEFDGYFNIAGCEYRHHDTHDDPPLFIRSDGALFSERHKLETANVVYPPTPYVADFILYSLEYDSPISQPAAKDENPFSSTIGDHTGDAKDIWWWSLDSDMETEETFLDTVTVLGGGDGGFFGTCGSSDASPGSPQTGVPTANFINTECGTKTFNDFVPQQVNKNGWALGGSANVSYCYNRPTPCVLNGDTGGYVMFPGSELIDMNDDNAVIGLNSDGKAFLYTEDNGSQLFQTLFSPAITGSFSGIYPLQITNMDSNGHTRIVFYATYIPVVQTCIGSTPGDPQFGQFLLIAQTGDLYRIDGGYGVMNANGVMANGPMLYVPVDITIKKEGTQNPPTDGVLVTKGETLDIKLNDNPTAPFPIPDTQIVWYSRQLKTTQYDSDPEHNFDPWSALGDRYSGREVHYATQNAGIFQFKGVLNASGTSIDCLYLRRQDAQCLRDSSGDMNPIYQKGQPDYVGVVSAPWQINAVNGARLLLGSTNYELNSPALYLDTIWFHNVVIPKGRFKCNGLVYLVEKNAGAPVPVISGRVVNTRPPRAYDWWNSSCNISGWQHMGDSAYPEPGFVVAGSDAVDAGHCGVLDYDGAWINGAGEGPVNRWPHITNKGDDYDAQMVRKYIGQ